MRGVRLALGVTAVTLTLALTGSSSALASETTLCTTEANSPFCEAGDRYPSGTKLKGNLFSSSELVTGAGTVVCENGGAIWASEEEGGEPLQGEMSYLSLISCSLGGEACAVEAVGLPFSGSVELLEAPHGTLTLAKGKGGVEPGLAVSCGKALSCTYSAPSWPMLVVGGEPVYLSTGLVTLKGSGKICTETAKWSAAFEIGSLERAFVGLKEETLLCGSASHIPLCFFAERYPAETTIEASIPPTGTTWSLATGLGTVTCMESDLTFTTVQETGKPLLGTISSHTFSGCQLGLTSCTVVALALPGTAAISADEEGNATFTVMPSESGIPGVKVVCGGLLKCNFKTEAMTLQAFGSSHPVFLASSLPLYPEGPVCPEEEAIWTAYYHGVAPGPVFFTHT